MIRRFFEHAPLESSQTRHSWLGLVQLVEEGNRFSFSPATHFFLFFFLPVKGLSDLLGFSELKIRQRRIPRDNVDDNNDNDRMILMMVMMIIME